MGVVEELLPLVLKKEYWDSFALADELKVHLETIQFIIKEFKAPWCKLAVIPNEVFHVSIIPHVARRMLYEEDIPVHLSISKPLMMKLDDIPIDVGNLLLGFVDLPDDEHLQYLATYSEQSAAIPRRACVVNFYDFDWYMDGVSHITVMPLDRRTMEFLGTRTKQDMRHDIEPRMVPPPAYDSDGEEDAYTWPQGLSSQRLLRELENWYTFLGLEQDLVWHADEFEAAVRARASSALITVHQRRIGSKERYVFTMRRSPSAQEHVFMVVDVHALEIHSAVWPGTKGPLWNASTCNIVSGLPPRNIWCLNFVSDWCPSPSEFCVVLPSLVPTLVDETLERVSSLFIG